MNNNRKKNIPPAWYTVLICILFFSSAYCTTIQTSLIRFPLWVLLDPYPGIPRNTAAMSQSDLVTVQIAELKELSVFLLEGQLFGWEFSYTPSDKTRGVEEYFSFEPIARLESNDQRITYTDFVIEESRLSCWVEFQRTEDLMRRSNQWQSVVYPKISGKGSGAVSDGVAGIKNAYRQSVLHAVRAYAQKIEKNKPKEINGSVFLIDPIRLYIQSGDYIADIRLFLNIKTIIPYTFW